MANQGSGPSYLKAFLGHPGNKMALLAVGAAGVLVSIPFGLTGLLLVGTAGLGLEALAALLVPSLPPFKRAVDHRHRKQQLDERVAHYITQIQSLGGSSAQDHFRVMTERVTALYQAASQSNSSLAVHDIAKLEDLTVDYLGLSVLSLSLARRKEPTNEAVVIKKIAAIETQLKDATLREDEIRQLRNALAEYTETMFRIRRLGVRRSTLEATLMSLPDKVEEVYQLVMSAPYAKDMGSRLEDSLSRLRIEEEVAAELGSSDWEPPSEIATKPTVNVPPSLDAARRARAQAAS